MPARSRALLLACLGLPACGIDEIRINEPAPTPAATQPAAMAATPSLPRLAPGPHLGMITGFDPLGASRAAAAAQRYAAARAAGATIGRVQIDWSELEPSPGAYDGQALADAFADPALASMNVAVLVSTLDSDGLTLPDHLMEDGGLRGGLALSSPEIRDAFTAFLDWLGPELQRRDVWLVSIGNEPAGPIEDGLVSEDEAIGFFSPALERWNQQVPEIGITVTFTSDARSAIPGLFEAVRARSDIVTFNYYCLDRALLVTGPAEWEARLAEMKSDAGEKDIFFQELGCPVGYGPADARAAIGGSLANQTQFVELFGERIASDPQLRAATLFQLFDWSPQLARSFSDPLRQQGAPVFADRLEEWLATVGLVRWDTQADRPAWSAWLEALRQVAEARGS